MENMIQQLRDSSEMQFPAVNGRDESFSDDGSVFIVRSGISYCFSLGQELSRREWSRQARNLGRQFDIPREEVSQWILTEFGR